MTQVLEKIPSKFWTDVALGTVDESYEFLALKIALSRLRIQAKGGPDAARQAGEELRAFFTKYQGNPTVQSDLDRLCKKAGVST